MSSANRTRKTVLILGASRYYIRSIEATRRAGYRVIAVDRNPQSPGFAAADIGETCDIVDREGVLALARRHAADGVVPVNDYGVPTAAYVAARLGLPGISEETAELATNKERMRAQWLRSGVRCPKVCVATRREQFDSAVAVTGYPCILKPAHGVGGASRGVIVVQNGAELDAAIVFSQTFYADKATLVEEFVQSEVEHSAEVLIHKGRPYVIAISDKVKTPLPYRVDKNVLYPTAVVGERLARLEQAIGEAVLALGIRTGVAHVELATVRDGSVLFELGARCGGGGTPEPIVPFVTGIDEFLEQVRIYTGDAPTQVTPTRHRACNYHFLTPRPGWVRAIAGIDQVKRLPGILDAELLVRPGDQVKQVRVGTERAGFIIAGGKTRQEVVALADRAEALIQMEYEDGPGVPQSDPQV